jgi:RNA polymerase sigma factor (sigma-70 family)
VGSSESFMEDIFHVLNKSFSNAIYCNSLFRIKPFAILHHHTPSLDEKWAVLSEQHALNHPMIRQLLSAPRTEMKVTRRDFQSTALYDDISLHLEAHHQMWLSIKADNEILNCIYSRENPCSEKAVAMMSMILPHLELAWTNWKQTRLLNRELKILRDSIGQSQQQEAAVARLHRMIDGLPPRQREVTELVAGGFDNQQIADELCISKRTVQKHLELVFQSLEVHHRTELASKWHRAHSVKLY